MIFIGIALANDFLLISLGAAYNILYQHKPQHRLKCKPGLSTHGPPLSGVPSAPSAPKSLRARAQAAPPAPSGPGGPAGWQRRRPAKNRAEPPGGSGFLPVNSSLPGCQHKKGISETKRGSPGPSYGRLPNKAQMSALQTSDRVEARPPKLVA